MKDYNYKKLPPFKGMVLQNFPFIEEDFDAITNYQLLCKVVEYLKNVIANELTMEENITNLYNAFNELKNYVDNYFANLDVQEEINNKLDEMVEDGTLLNIITNYTSITKVYNTTVELLEDTNVLENQKVKTLGYYEINDGGGAEFIIDSENKPQMIIKDNTINIRQLGARPQDKENNKYDINEYLLKYLELCDLYDTRLKLYIPSGIWYLSPINLARTNGYEIYGDEGFILGHGIGTILTTLTHNQTHLIHFGDNTKFTTNCVIKNLIFSSSDYYYNSNTNTFITSNSYRKYVTNSLTKFLYNQMVITDNLFFQHIDGTALEITSSWEMYFPVLNFRDVNATGSCIMKFGTRDTTLQGSANPSAIYFNNVMFEKVMGDLIYSAYQSRLQNCVFNNINFEDWLVDWNGYETTTFTSENIPTYEASNPIHMSIFRFGGLGLDTSSDGTLIINNIQLNNTSSHFTVYNNSVYCYDRLFSINGNYSAISLIVNNIDSIGMIKDNCLLYSKDNVDQSSKFIIDNINNRGNANFYFDIDNFPYIKCESRLKGHNSTNYFYLPSTCTPAYNLVNNRQTGDRFLKSDSECKNLIKIGTKIVSSSASINFVLSSMKLYLRAKVNDGETARVVLSESGTSNQQTKDLVGTGNFEVYDIDIDDSKFAISANMFMAVNNSYSRPILIDYIIN